MGHTQCCSAAPTDNNCRVHFGCFSPTKKENHQLASGNVYIYKFFSTVQFPAPCEPKEDGVEKNVKGVGEESGGEIEVTVNAAYGNVHLGKFRVEYSGILCGTQSSSFTIPPHCSHS